VSLQEDYPTLLPLPFTPLFTPASLAAYVPACTSNVSVYGVNHFNSTVKRFTTCPLALGQTIQVGTHPLQAAFTPDGGTLIVTRFDNAVVFIDTATDTVTTTLPTSSYNPNGIAISPDGTKAYITSYNAFTPVIFVIDIPSRKIMPQTLQVNSYPKSIFLTPDGALAWVTFAASSSLYVIDTLSMTVAATVNAGGVAETGLAFSPDGTRAYVAVLGGQVAVFDTATLSQVALIAVGDQPTDILVSSDGSRAYVNSYAANAVMSVIDTATNTVLQTIQQGGPAMGLSIVH
jgi:YVTN family beta-propeller protein